MSSVVVRVDFARREVVEDPDRMLSGPQVAELLGVSAGTWRSLVCQGYAPPADDPGGDGPVQGRRPRWRLSTVRGFKRAGRGRRTDLGK